MNLAALACLAVLLVRSNSQGGTPAGSPGADVDQLRSIAVELENKSLDLEAALAWQAYLDAAPAAPERAEVFYRVGKLYMQAQKYGDAAAAFVRAEKAVQGDPELVRKIGLQLVECLRRLGRYGEMGRELSRRVEVGAKDTAKGKVLATITGQEFTDADLDRLVERRVDGMLALQGTGADPQRRQSILKQMSSPEVRRQLLQELIQGEVFCRRARETGMDREPSFVQARDQMEQSLLASRFLARELEKIQPTEVDLQSFYKANSVRYQEPESLEVLSVRLSEKEKAEEVLKKIATADDFRKLAARRSGGKDADETPPPPPRRLVRGQEDPTLGSVEPLFALAEGQWTKEPHLKGDDRYLVLVEKKIPVRLPPFEQLSDRVRADYTSVKQQELAEKLFQDLLTRYQVRIAPADEAGQGPGKRPK